MAHQMAHQSFLITNATIDRIIHRVTLSYRSYAPYKDLGISVTVLGILLPVRTIRSNDSVYRRIFA